MSKRFVLIVAAASFMLLVNEAQAASGIVGLGNTPNDDAEFLFAFSNGGTPNTLTLNGSIVLSTGTSEFNAGVNNQGWWGATLGNDTANDNYFVGYLSNDGSQPHNNFFTFDISGLSGRVTGAVFDVKRYIGNSDLGATAHTYSIYDVSTDAATLNANVGTSAAIFTDLGSGTLYGSYSISVAGDASEILHLTLDDAALTDLNAAIAREDRFFSIGGTLNPSSVPDSCSTFILTAISVILLGLVSRRQRSFAS